MSYSTNDVFAKTWDGNNSTTAFPWNNALYDVTHLRVILYNESTGAKTEQTYNTHYTIALATDNSYGTINMVTAPNSLEKLRAEYNVPMTQLKAYQTFQASLPETLEEAFDLASLQSLTNKATLERSIKAAPGEILDGTLPNMFGKGGYVPTIVDDGDDTFSVSLEPGLGAAIGGPAGGSSTNNAVVRWDGTTGRLAQDSVVIIDDSGNVTAINDLTTTGNTLLGGTLGVTGLTTLLNTQINGTLGVLGVATIGPGSLSVSSGDLMVGLNNNVGGWLKLYANGTETGGTADFYIHENADTNYEYFRFRAGDQSNTADEDFYLGTDVTKDLFKFDRLGNITVTAGVTGASLDLASGASVTSIDITTAADSDTALVTSQGINEAIATAVGAANSLQEAYNVDEVIITTSGGADPVLLKTVLADDPVASPVTQSSGAKVFVTQDSTGVEGVSITSGGTIKYTRGLICNAISFPAVQAVDVDQGRSGLNFGVSGEYLHWSIYSDSAETTPSSSEHVTFFNVERSGNEYDATTKTITGITKANPAVFTCTGHSFTDKDSIHISGVTSSTNDDFADAINNYNWNVNYIDANSFSLQTKAELGSYTAFSTSGYTGTYNTGGTAQKKGITVDRIWMKMGRTEHATDGGDIVDIFDAQYNGGVSPHLTIGADATVTGKLSLGASDFQFDPTPGAGVVDLISDTTACALRLKTTSGTTLGSLSVSDGVGTILSSSSTGTKDLILKVNGAVGTTALTFDGATGNATFTGDVEVGGQLTVAAAGGENALWEQWIPASDWTDDNGIQAPGAIATYQLSSSRKVHKAWLFHGDGVTYPVERLYTTVALPFNYQSSALRIDYYWHQSGTDTGNVYLFAMTYADEHGDSMGGTPGGGNEAVVQTALGNVTDLQITTTTTSLIPHTYGSVDITGNANRLMHLGIYRHASNASDTLTDDVYLIGVRVRFA
jgi:hypothetical protein